MSIHEFSTSLARGQQGEAWLDRHFGQTWNIERASRRDERRGVDRWFSDDWTPSFGVQYKTDEKAAETGNAFIEVVSGGPEFHQNGWLWTTQAAVLVYWLPSPARPRFWVLDPEKLRKLASDWHKRYPVRSATNRGYWTYGICPSIAELDSARSEMRL